MTSNPYRDSISRIRKAFGQRYDLIPIPVVNQVLSVVGEADVVAASADLKASDSTKPTGNYFLLTEEVAMSGTWTGTQPSDLYSGNFTFRVTRRSGLTSVRVVSDAGAAWVADQWGTGLHPWSAVDVRVVVSYGGLDDVVLPLDRSDGYQAQILMDALLGDLANSA